jgi:hypothetical protein
MKKIILLAFLFICCINGWVWGESPESYLPLQEGLTWEFQQTILDLKTQKQVAAAKSIKENLAPTELQGVKVIPQVFSFYQPANQLKQKTKSFIVQDASGFHVVARQSLNEPKPSFIPEKFYILKFPLTKGASWEQPVKGLIIKNTIEGRNETVQVPAGTFRHCLLVKKLYFHKKDPKSPVQEGLFWFAPEVGNVKVVIKNSPENKEIIQELVSFKK